MKKLSVTIITKNEEAHIADALASVSFADETIVVDSGSTDRTVEIAEKSATKVVFHEWPGHVAQKDYAVSLAANDWVLSIDADERVSPELAAGIREALANPTVDGFRVRRKAFYLGRWIEHCGWYPDYRIRLWNRRRGRWGGMDPHDWVEVDGAAGTIDADILHYTYDGISDHVKTIDFFTTIGARRYFEAGRRSRLWDLVLRPPLAFLAKYFVKQGFRDGAPGLVVCLLHGYYVFLKYAKLWELQRGGGSAS